MLPATTGQALPSYSDKPELLDPSHCRLCLDPVDGSALPQHLEECHGLTQEEYRRQVLQQTMAEWPQPISPQILRSRLAAFKEEMCDHNFLLQPCASCAREKRQCKLTRVSFPPRGEEQPPEWLGLSKEEWWLYGERWFDAVDSLLNIERYLNAIFLADDRVEAARRAVQAFQDQSLCCEPFPTVDAASSWLERVLHWRSNLLRDLVADSVEAPGGGGGRWLLFRSAELCRNEVTGEIKCNLCRKCCAALARRDARTKRPAPHMPEQARANRLWHGPEPPELLDLSYAEAKVINLARVYVSVKRVFLDRRSYARAAESEAPRYHQKNVVAFPQKPDSALRAIGMSPQNLAKTLLVQFTGGPTSAPASPRSQRLCGQAAPGLSLAVCQRMALHGSNEAS